MKTYCVYLTTYKGSLLPPFYIGSSTLSRLLAGYNGSVKSRKYSAIWKQERLNNPDLFSTRILSGRYKTAQEAQEVEHRLQRSLNAVRSPMYINMSYATKNGCFGRDVSKELHPMFGRKHTNASRVKISANHADVSGEKNGRAIWYRFTSPDGKKHDIFGGFRKFCEEHDLPTGSAHFMLDGRKFVRGKCAGWSCQRL
jgi:hypothetical protein